MLSIELPAYVSYPVFYKNELSVGGAPLEQEFEQLGRAMIRRNKAISRL